VDSKYKKIGLLDHMGWGNMGDAAIQESFIINIKRRLPGASLVGFSLYPDDTRKRHNIACYPIRWWYPGWNGEGESSADAPVPVSRVRLLLKRCRPFYDAAKPLHDFARELAHLVRSYHVVKSLDLLIMSGGGQLCDLHGDLPYNVFKFCVLAKLSNTPVFIVGVGADRLERPLTKFFARWAVRLANYSSFRSKESQALIRSIGVKTETDVCPDPAYSLVVREYLAADRSKALTSGQSQDLLRALGLEIEPQVQSQSAYHRNVPNQGATRPAGKPKPKVGLNPMGFCDPRRWPVKDDVAYRHYLDKVAAFSGWLLAHNYNLEIFTSDVITDVLAIEDLKKRILAGLSADESASVVFRPLPTLRELLVQMSTFDYVITPKFHGVIFSHLLGKPVIALSYLPKIDHLMRAVGHDEYCLDIGDFDLETLIERFQSLVDEQDYLKALFDRTSEAYANELRSHFDNLFGREVVTGMDFAEDEPAEVASSNGTRGLQRRMQ
jgi:polysaccharide pyruvyl transferase WcaK-like protein